MRASTPEAGINAAIAGHLGVPVIMISGDDTFVERTRSLLGDVEAAGSSGRTAYAFGEARFLAFLTECRRGLQP